jgi:hypothetical protein
VNKAQANKDEAISGLIEARGCILAAATLLPVEKRGQVFLGTWSVRDLLAHLVGWDFTNIEAGREILEGKLPSFYAHHDRDWRTYNAGLVERYKKDDWADMVSAVEESHRRLIGFLQRVAVEEFDRDRGLRAGRYKVTIARLIKAETTDERKHCEQIREFGEQ